MPEALTGIAEFTKSMGNLIEILASTLGFLGIQCLLLLLISFVLLFFMNQINAVFPKFNYFCVIFASVVLGLITDMNYLGVVKYLAVMAFPFILSIILPKATNLIWKNPKTE